MMPASPHHHSRNSMADRSTEIYEEVKALCKEAQRLSLSAYFEKQSGLECRFARGYAYSEWCPHCGLSSKDNEKVYIKDDEIFSCYACGRWGSIIDAEILQFGGSARAAAEHLLGKSHADFAAGRKVILRQDESNEKKRQRELEETRKYAAVAEVLRRICRGTRMLRDSAVIRYLTEERGIPLEVVEQAIGKGMLRTLPTSAVAASALIRSIVPEELLRTAQLWSEDAKMPWIAYRPLWFFMPGALSAELRIITAAKKGDKKSLRIGRSPDPYFWEGRNPAGCACVEGFIDVMSLAALDYEGDIMGLPGVNTWEPTWFTRLPQVRGTKRFDTMFDNDADPDKFDNPGQDAAAKLGAYLREQNLPWKNIVPPAGDVNDFLKAKRKPP